MGFSDLVGSGVGAAGEVVEVEVNHPLSSLTGMVNVKVFNFSPGLAEGIIPFNFPQEFQEAPELK